MKQPPPAKGSASGARREPAPTARGASRPKGHDYHLTVRFYCSMKARRVYPLTVEVPRGGAGRAAEGPGGADILVRPLVPGALVVPAQLPLDLGRPGAKATFHVTPLACGKLPEARVQIVYDGHPVQDLPVRMKAGTQGLTWLLLLAAVVLPPLLLHYTRYAPLRGNVPDRRLTREALDRVRKGLGIPGMGGKDGDNDRPPVAPPPPPAGGRGDVLLIPRAGAPLAATDFESFEDVLFLQADEPKADAEKEPKGKPPAGKMGGGMGGMMPPGGGAPAGPNDAPGVPPPNAIDDPWENYLRPGQPDEVLAYRLETYLTANAPDVIGLRRAFAYLGQGVGFVYGLLCDRAADIRPAFWLGAGLLGLAFASWTRNRAQKVTRTRLVTLPAPTGMTLRAAQSSETLPLSPHGDLAE